MPVTEAHLRLQAGVSGVVRLGEPLARHTSFRIGGPSALFVECDTVGDLAFALDTLEEEEVAWTVLGKGSNVLASDEGYDGAVLVLGRDFKRWHLDDEGIHSGAGVALATLVQTAFHNGLTGLEFAVGVPGTVGGALAMNAGSRDAWIGSVVDSVTVYSPGVGLAAYGGAEIPWGYRRSGLPSKGVIVETSLKLACGDLAQIRRVMEASLRRRKKSQPLRMHSAGSVFVNPEGDSAGRLIEAAGLKGAVVGGAQVSELHANFIVNTGTASAADVIALVDRVQQAVRETHGVELRPEIRFLGAFEAPEARGHQFGADEVGELPL